MGNSIKITASYENQKEVLATRELGSFEAITDYIKSLFQIDPSTPIVIKLDNAYHSTAYTWPREFKSSELDFQIWNQIERSVRDSENTSNLLDHIFKIQRNDGKILSLGVFISPNVCIIPKKSLINNEEINLSNKRLVFFTNQDDFKDREAEYFLNNEENVAKIIGEHPSNQHFIMMHFKRSISRWSLNLPERTDRIRGHVIFFNSKTQMLSSERTAYQNIAQYGTFSMSNVKEEWLPGAIFVSEKSEIIGIYTGAIGQLFIQTKEILKEISNSLKKSIEEDQREIRDMILDINGVELAIPEISSVLQNLLPFNMQRVEIYNPLSSLFQ